MPGPFHKSFLVCLAVAAGLFLGGEAVFAASKDAMMLFAPKGSSKTQGKSDKALPEIPENLDQAKINEIVAGLSDDQVRRLLIQELEKTAAAKVKKQEPKPVVGLARIVQTAEENTALFNKRLSDIRSGAVAVPEFLPKAYADLRGPGGTSSIFIMFAAIMALLGAGLGAECLFGRYTADMRRRLMGSPAGHWLVKLKRLLLACAIEFFSICVFSGVTLVVFFCFFNRGPFARLVFMTFLIVILVVRGINLLSRLLLAPDRPALRFLPLTDTVARSIHRWVMAFALVLGAGFLIRALLELQGITEETVIFIRAFNAAVVLCMLVYLILGNRESVAQIICSGPGDRSAGVNLLRSQLASFWHLLALPYLVLVWCLWVFYLLVERSDLVIPLLALLSSVPLYIILDWLGQKFLSAMFGFVDKQEPDQQPCEGEGTTEDKKVVKAPDGTASTGVADVGRFVRLLRSCLSFSVAGIIFFWLLQLWGFEADVGEEFTSAALKILLIVSLAWVAWKLIAEAINRKIKAVQGHIGVDEDSDEGGMGTGGSRLGTLLHLFRKFLLVVLLVTVALIILSAMGIDTKPLLAGAGILGLAIGLGTQNLIKDIISGLFFLLDDAFRIGDYIESGKAKGTVEAITIRSLNLRHTRGMVHNVPFSQLGIVTNFSRDYNIVKLDFRVPFDTDVDKVRKVVKKINKEIQEDEEMGPNLLGPIKCAGVLALDDSALIMRVKFKSKPGLQFMIQRQVFRRLKELFDKAGLEFATRHVMVRLPEEPIHDEPDKVGEASGAAPPSSKKVLSGAAAAAIAAAIAEEEAKKKALQEEADAKS